MVRGRGFEPLKASAPVSGSTPQDPFSNAEVSLDLKFSTAHERSCPFDLALVSPHGAKENEFYLINLLATLNPQCF